MDTDLFFPDDYSTVDPQVQRACAACPVRAECLEWALTIEGTTRTEDRFGIFGGLTPMKRYTAYRNSRWPSRQPKQSR